MLMNNSLANPESQPSAVYSLCAVKSFEDSLRHLRGHTVARVRDGDGSTRPSGAPVRPVPGS